MCERGLPVVSYREDVQMRLRLLSGLLAAATLFVTGCFGVGDIDRTQPDKVKKSIFKNANGSRKEYFFRQTIIDVPATNGVTFVGEQGEVDRVVFEVTEDYLYAYRSYGSLTDLAGGAIEGNQADGYLRPGTNYFGSPLAAFPITSHFDVKRQYNASTGEQTNVIVEDGQDRPWYDREFMRVNWATNDIADFRFGGAAALQSTITNFVQEADDNPENIRDRPVISEDYLDVVTQYQVEPESEDLSAYGYGMLPVCYFYTGVYKDCMGGTIRVRSSFLPVDKLPRYAAPGEVGGKSDYTTLNYDDVRFEKFGFFRTERYTTDDQYGIVEPGQIRMANRWNLWKDAESCYDADADLPYSGCSPDQLRTVVYYLNEGFPREINEMVDMASSNADEWDRVFKEAVKASTGWSDADFGNKRLYTICTNNPVQAGDPAECGAEGLAPQIGDLRYSMYYYVPNFQDSSPLGYGPSAADPFTGEIIQGNAFYYGQPAGTLAARTLDILKLELGINTEAGLSDGLPAREAVTRSLQAAKVRDRSGQNENIGDRARELAANLDIQNKARRLNRQIAGGQAFIDKRPSRQQALATSNLDELALTDEIREVFAAHVLDTNVAVDKVDDTIAARLFNDDILFNRVRERELKMLMHPSKACVLSAEDVFDEGLLGLLRTVRVKFYNTATTPPSLKAGVTEKDVFNFMLASTMGDTQLHEIGHTVGLRHNFAGSSDVLNYGPDYWALRSTLLDADGERPKPEWEVTANGTDRVTLDGMIEVGLRDNQDSSIMDYASTYGTTNTLGSYDLAAIKYAYGDMVEVFNSPDITPERARLLGQGEVHYRNYPEIVSNAATVELRVASMYDRRNVNFRKVPRRSAAVVGDPIEVPYSFCSDEYRDASATCALWDAGGDNFERTEYSVEKYRNYRIYNAFKRERLTFGLDIFAYLGRIYGRDYTYMLNQYKNWVNDELIIRRDDPCLVVRNGEITVEAANRFAADSCGLPGFVGTVATVNLMAEVIESPDVGCYARLKTGCYDANVGNAGTSLAPEEEGIRFVSADPNVCDTYVPVQPPVDSRDDRRVAMKITAKSPYMHVNNSESCARLNDRDPVAFVPPVVLDNTTNQPVADAFLVRNLADDGQVRAANTLYDRERYGYYFYNKPTVIGSWWEKWLAVKAIGDGNTDFIGVDASSDTRSFLISLNTIFGDNLNNLIGGAVTDDVSGYGPALRADGSMEPLPLLDLTSGNTFNREAVSDPFINPDQQYTFRLIAMYNAAYNGQSTDDFEFGESLRVGMTNSITNILVEQEILDDPALFVSVEDPVSKMLYFAIKQNRAGSEDLYSIGFEYLRSIKAKYYVGGADGPGKELLAGYDGTFEFEPRGDLEIAHMMARTAEVFGYADVWSGNIDF